MRVAFRVDASQRIGAGHMMRCLTIADALAELGAVSRFLSRGAPRYLTNLIAESGHEHFDLTDRADDVAGNDAALHADEPDQDADVASTRRGLAGVRWDWLIVDQYTLDARWESQVRSSADHLLVIDDLADRHHDCDVLLDQNRYSDMAARYMGKVPAQCRLLLGERYAQLRSEFAYERTRTQPRNGVVKRIFVSMGGIDSENYTLFAIRTLAGLLTSDVHVDVVIGSGHPDSDAVQAECAAHGFACHVQPTAIATLMAHADLAVGAGGSMTWERCCVGLPTIAMAVADNQRPLVRDAAREGLLYAPSVDRRDPQTLELHIRAVMANPRLLQMMSLKCWQRVDGRGTKRLLRVLGCSSITVRRATIADAALLFDWRNHESVRRVSRSSRRIEWSEHEAWIRAATEDPARLLLIGEHNGRPLGTVRFDMSGTEAEVSIYLAPDHQSGIGSDLLAAAEAELRKRRPDVVRVTACVDGANDRSGHLFEASGYVIHHSVYTKENDA